MGQFDPLQQRRDLQLRVTHFLYKNSRSTQGREMYGGSPTTRIEQRKPWNTRPTESVSATQHSDQECWEQRRDHLQPPQICKTATFVFVDVKIVTLVIITLRPVRVYHKTKTDRSRTTQDKSFLPRVEWLQKPSGKPYPSTTFQEVGREKNMVNLSATNPPAADVRFSYKPTCSTSCA